MRRALLAMGLLTLCAPLGCGGADPETGLDALLRVDGGQFRDGALPAPSGGPEVLAVDNPTNQVRPGEVDRDLGGSLEGHATAVALQLEGDRGHWIVLASPPDVTVPDQPTFQARLSFSPELAEGATALLIAAVDGSGTFGAPQRVELTAAHPPPPEGALVFSLRWDRDADLDLRVVTPDGVEVWNRNPNSAQGDRPGLPPSPEQIAAGGALDLDSNAGCLIDGVRQENVVWTAQPPAGRYLVRVDTPSLCGTPGAHWEVEARRDGELLARAEGFSTPDDTRFSHDLGAGVLALEVVLP